MKIQFIQYYNSITTNTATTTTTTTTTIATTSAHWTLFKCTASAPALNARLVEPMPAILILDDFDALECLFP